jgi:hypothetical protein
MVLAPEVAAGHGREVAGEAVGRQLLEGHHSGAAHGLEVAGQKKLAVHVEDEAVRRPQISLQQRAV